MTKSANDLKNNLAKISTWGSQWKMNFKTNPPKRTQEVIFSQKFPNNNHAYLIFNHNCQFN